MKKITLLSVIIFSKLVAGNISFAEDVKEHNRFTKEYAQFVQDKFDREAELRERIREYILANKDLLEQHTYGKKDMEVSKIIYGDFSLSEDDNAVLNYFIEHELNSKEREFVDEVSKAFRAWTMYVYGEEMAKIKIGKETFNQMKHTEDEEQNPDYISANYIKPLLQPYLALQLSQEDLSGIGHNDLWPRCKLNEEQIKAYFKIQGK